MNTFLSCVLKYYTICTLLLISTTLKSVSVNAIVIPQISKRFVITQRQFYFCQTGIKLHNCVCGMYDGMYILQHHN